MATSGPTNLPAFFSGDADFRTWVQGIHNALAGFADLTQTADTGQIAPATVARPAVNVAAGYEIWRFNDALQATVPIFIKLEYGVGSVADRPSLWLTIGTGSTGAGVLTGLSSRVQIAAQSSKTAAAVLPFVGSCEAGRLDLGVNIDVNVISPGLVVHIERSRDAAGAATADGAVMALATNVAGNLVAYTLAGGMIATSVNPKLLMSMSPAFTPGLSAVGADIAVDAGVWFAGKPLYVLGLVSYNPVDIPALTSFAATVLGAARTYLALGPVGSTLTPQSNGAAAMRFE